MHYVCDSAFLDNFMNSFYIFFNKEKFTEAEAFFLCLFTQVRFPSWIIW